MKKLTIDDIDSKLVEMISGGIRDFNLEYRRKRGVIAETLLWLAENPPIMQIDPKRLKAHEYQVQSYGSEYLSRVFLKPEPEVPAEVKAILEDYGMVADSTVPINTVEMALKLVELGRLQGKQEGGAK